MALATVSNGEIVRHTHVNQLVNALTGVSGAGEQLALTQYNNSSNYALDVRNLDTTNGYGLRVRDAASNALILAYKNTLQLGASAANDTLSILANISGKVYIGDSANASMTTGLTINQGAADDEIFALKSSDVAHGMTTITETDTYGLVKKYDGGNGGLNITGLNDTNQPGLYLRGLQATDNTLKTTGGVGAVLITGETKSGTDAGAIGADGNILSIGTAGTTRFLFDTEGSGHADVAWTTYDKYDDLALIAEVERELLAREDEAQTERRHYLEQAGIIGKGSWHFEGGRPRAMVNTTRLAMLHHGALIQVGEKLAHVYERLNAAEQRLAALPGA